jgi:hypothetical protein
MLETSANFFTRVKQSRIVILHYYELYTFAET